MKARLIMVGPPGAGKGTQAKVLAEKLGVPTISTGSIFRTHISEGTELGKIAASYIDGGNLVPDEVTDALVKDRLSQADVKAGFILDGYPRNVHQVAALDKILTELGVSLDGVIELAIPDEAIVGRLLHRAEIENRVDDTEEVIRHRIEVYHQETAPLIDIYQERGLLLNVDGTGTIAEVLASLVNSVHEFLNR
ncbi:adenylate kinase [Arcanobacterium hippocoleae]